MSQEMKIREAKPSDISFIYSTWLNSYHYDSWTKSCPKGVYFSNYKQIIDHILSKAQTLVACLPDDEDVILGYMVSEPETLHYAFVKEAFRGFGIGKKLFKACNFKDLVTVTHKTKTVNQLLRDRKDLVYNPFILFKTEETHG